MGEMIAMIAHQWRQPLNVIILNITTIQMMVHQKKIKKTELDNIIDSINNTVNYMNQTIDDFRDFLKEDTKLNEVSILDLILKPKHLIAAELELLNISFEYNCQLDTDKLIVLDSSKFYQVILNLYKNSIDEFKSRDIKNPYIQVNISQNDLNLVITISDNAGGIPENIIDDIFNPYFSTKGKNGTGIGLYMSKKIIQESVKGTISVTNSKNGAIFTISIPYLENDKSTTLLDHNDYHCFKWNKDQNRFIKLKNCEQSNILKEIKEITKFLDQYFIPYLILNNNDIQIGLN
jgi:signal transduction histidine kinase